MPVKKQTEKPKRKYTKKTVPQKAADANFSVMVRHSTNEGIHKFAAEMGKTPGEFLDYLVETTGKQVEEMRVNREQREASNSLIGSALIQIDAKLTAFDTRLKTHFEEAKKLQLRVGELIDQVIVIEHQTNENRDSIADYERRIRKLEKKLKKKRGGCR